MCCPTGGLLLHLYYVLKLFTHEFFLQGEGQATCRVGTEPEQCVEGAARIREEVPHHRSVLEHSGRQRHEQP